MLPWCQAYGLADLATEALGGFFLFGAANAFRHQFEWLDCLRESGAVVDPSMSSASKAKESPMQLSKEHPYCRDILSHKALEMGF